MKTFKSFFAVALTVLGLLSSATQIQAQVHGDAIASRGLFVNLTTDDTWPTARAISFAHEKLLKTGHHRSTA